MNDKLIPVYLVCGFLDSGKTSFIKNSFINGFFPSDKKILLIQCEEGEEELSDELLSSKNVSRIILNDTEQFDFSFLEKTKNEINPQLIVIEWNGMASVSDVSMVCSFSRCPVEKKIVLADASVFRHYIKNINMLYVDMLSTARLVIFNRCTGSEPLIEYKRAIKLANPHADIEFQDETGNSFIPDDILPFDINAEEIIIENNDFAVWQMHFREHSEQYINKRITLQGEINTMPFIKSDDFILCRTVIDCCGFDPLLMGISCSASESLSIPEKGNWAEISGIIMMHKDNRWGTETPYIQIDTIKEIPVPEDPVISYIF